MVLYVQFPAGQFCVCTRGLFLCGSPRGSFCVCARQFFFLILCTVFFRGGRETSSSEALFLSLPRPLPLFQHCRLATVLCTRAYFSLQFTAGQFCVRTRLVSLRVSAGRFLRLRAAVFLSYSLHCVFRGGRETASSVALFLSLPAPALSSSTAGLPRCFAHGLIFLCSSLRGSSAYARATCFFAGLRGVVSAPARMACSLCCSLRGSSAYARGSFSFLFSALCFPGRERNLFFRGVVSLPPPSPPALPALQACRGALHTGLFFFAVHCGAVLRMHAWLVSLQVSAGRFLRLHARCSCLQTVRAWTIYQRLSDFPFKK